MFDGVSLCIFGTLDAAEVRRVQRGVTALGGDVTAKCTQATTHILTAEGWGEPLGALLARHEDAVCVRPQWVMDCIAAGQLLDEEPYTVRPTSQ